MIAVFALRAQVGGRGEPDLCYWLLENGESWRERVDGDGGSYSPGGPNDMERAQGEPYNDFIKRVNIEADEWEKAERRKS